MEEKKYECPFEIALEIISGKWKGLILWHLCQRTYRYSELKREISGITQKMLTQSLRALEEKGIIHRKVYPQIPPKVEYSITPLGKKVQPILYMLQDWGRDIAKENNIPCKN
ncbi:winged helix-turn-helix transcriptional regulator [Caminibacter pacificus]|jgi:DNA-binding HxlR family transcriptional regulator